MSFTEINVKEFIERMINYENVDDILEMGKTQSEKGFLYERLWDICIKFGFVEVFPRADFTHLTGNSNTGKMKKLTSFHSYLTQKVYSGNSGGTSDISLIENTSNTYIFISSKYPRTYEDISKQKSVDYYDIHKLISMIDDNKQIYKNFKIYLLVPDKISVLEKVKNANKSSKYITKYMLEEQILDKQDLNKAFLLWKEEMIKHGFQEFDERFLIKKENLILRFHQELITKKTSNLIEKGEIYFLWGCKCRSGKTYMLGGLIVKQMYIKKKLNVLIITPAPTETAPQFTEDLFQKYKEFKDFKIHHIEGSSMIDEIEVAESNIFVMSKQLLQKYIGSDTISIIKDLQLDIICFDENHFTGTTDLSRSILGSYSSKNTVRVYLTATYHKPLKEWGIPFENQMYWDIEDEEICKNESDILKLEDKHGPMVQETLQYFKDRGLSNRDIFNFYKKMPRLHVITNLMDYQRYEKIKEDIKGTKYGFCFDLLFSLNKNKTQFQFQKEVMTILRYISGSQKETDFKDGDKSIFSRITNTCIDNYSRRPFTQIWFLPSDNIHEISTCLEELMKKDKILKNYDVMCINRKNKGLAKDVKDEIQKNERIAQEEGKEGLILLAGNMLSLGITLHLCDVVFLMNNTLSSDKVLQQMYRCMTEGEDKKMGFVVDLNINRVLHTCIQYNIFKKDMSVEEKIQHLIKNHLINIDVDMFDHKKIDSDYVIKKLMEIWKSDPIHNFQTLLKNLDNEYTKFDNDTQKILNQSFTSSIKDEKVDITIQLKDEDDEGQELPSGIEKNESDSETNSETESIKSEKKEEIQISFTKDVLPYVIPLTCILTMKNNNKDFVKMLMDIQDNPELLDIFDDMCFVWWNKKDLIHIIKKIVVEFFDKNSNVYNISIQFKMSLQSLIDDPTELIKLINNCLKPKQKEKQENGEVFTPMEFVFEILDQIDKDYIQKYGKSIFTEKDFKWGDIVGCGMGNFSIGVYIRLMNGLSSIILDESERKKHIIENMIYMAEFNKKNVFICQQIFDINNHYRLNLFEGDALTLDPFKEWGIKEFDVILGNPPYNKGSISCTRKNSLNKTNIKHETIWPRFIELSFRYLKKDGYHAFINPLSWLKDTHPLHKELLQKHVVWLKLWDNSQSKCTINADIPISLYIIFNRNNDIEKEKTEIISILKRRNLQTQSFVFLDKNNTVPLAYHSIFDKLRNFIEKNKLKLEFKNKTVKADGEKMKLPQTYSLEDKYAVDTYTLKDGIIVKKTDTDHPDANKRKLIVANKSSLAGIFIDEGKLSLTSTWKSYILGDKLELILKLMKFKICNIICHFTKYKQDFMENEIYNYIPDIRKLKIEDIEENEFYELVGFTEEEIHQIYGLQKIEEDSDSDHEDLSKKKKAVKVLDDKNDSVDSHLEPVKEIVKKTKKLPKKSVENESVDSFIESVLNEEIDLSLLETDDSSDKKKTKKKSPIKKNSV